MLNLMHASNVVLLASREGDLESLGIKVAGVMKTLVRSRGLSLLLQEDCMKEC